VTVRVGINGFGRIGRLVYRAMYQRCRDKLEVVAVNDLTDAQTNAHLLKYDSNYGQFEGDVGAKDASMLVDGQEIRVLAVRNPEEIPWSDYGVDLVIESTGLFTQAEKAAAHRRGSVKKVIISAPARGEDITIVLGVNEEKYIPEKHHIISNASCTTNCIAPVVKVLHQNFGIQRGLMTTVHSYTNDQKILDVFHRDLRRARAAAINIIPTTTGAARVVGVVIPELSGKLHGIAMRVPTSSVSVVDFVADLNQEVTVDRVNEAFLEAANGELNGILEYSDKPLVSTDFRGNSASSVFDSLMTMVMDKNMVKVLAWYDNEWGYSSRIADLATFISSKVL